MKDTQKLFPYGTLGIIPLASCTEMGKKVDEYLVKVERAASDMRMTSTLNFATDIRETVILLTLRLLDSVQEKVKGVLVRFCPWIMTYILC